MSTYEAILLGIVQGLTEFFPVSSSGHLILIQKILGLKNLENLILFDLTCHLGTLFSIIIFYSKKLKKIIFDDKTVFFQIILATLPLFPLVFILKEIKNFFGDPKFLGFFFLCTAFLIYLQTYITRKKNPIKVKKNKWRDALLIGFSQAAAIFPGLSRSGSTIASAKLLGWDDETAMNFSFFIAIPAILGGLFLESLKFISSGKSFQWDVNFFPFLFGFLSSFICGYFALQLLSRLIKISKFSYFAIYCIFLSMISFILFY